MSVVEVQTHGSDCKLANGKGRVHCGCNELDPHILCLVSEVPVSFHALHDCIRPYGGRQDVPVLNYVARQTARRITVRDWNSLSDTAARINRVLQLFTEELSAFHLYVQLIPLSLKRFY
jgi:hypothetical protein